MQWEFDRGLQVRMVLAILLLAAMPFAFVYTMSWAVANVIEPLAEALFETQLDWRLSISVPLILAVTVGGLALQFFLGDKIALRSVDATHVDRSEYPDVYRRVERLAQQVELPAPALAVSPSSVPNAFATGRSQSDATLVVTEGTLDSLEADELDAVLAHELAHVKNRDVAVMSLAYLLPSFTYVVAVGAYKLLGGLWHVIGHFHHSDSDDARPLAALIVLFVVSALVTLLVSALFWAGSFLLFRMLSQYRERAADRGSARITGDPLALASALETIDETMVEIPDRDLRDLDGGVEALYISPLDTPMFTDGDDALISRDLFPESHPPTEDRIEYLQELAVEEEIG